MIIPEIKKCIMIIPEIKNAFMIIPKNQEILNDFISYINNVS